MEKIRYLKKEFFVGKDFWKLIDKSDNEWYLYSLNDKFIIFEFRNVNCDFGGYDKRQIRPAVGYEKSEWYKVCDNKEDCYKWLKVKNGEIVEEDKVEKELKLFKKETKKPKKSKNQKIDQFTKDGTYIKTWCSYAEANRNGYNYANIINCCRGRLKTHKGYIWKYHTEKGED